MCLKVKVFRTFLLQEERFGCFRNTEAQHRAGMTKRQRKVGWGSLGAEGRVSEGGRGHRIPLGNLGSRRLWRAVNMGGGARSGGHFLHTLPTLGPKKGVAVPLTGCEVLDLPCHSDRAPLLPAEWVLFKNLPRPLDNCGH